MYKTLQEIQQEYDQKMEIIFNLRERICLHEQKVTSPKINQSKKRIEYWMDNINPFSLSNYMISTLNQDEITWEWIMINRKNRKVKEAAWSRLADNIYSHLGPIPTTLLVRHLRNVVTNIECALYTNKTAQIVAKQCIQTLAGIIKNENQISVKLDENRITLNCYFEFCYQNFAGNHKHLDNPEFLNVFAEMYTWLQNTFE